MKTAPRLDRNHHEIVGILEGHGFSVLSLAAIGKGCPDILAGCNGTTTVLIEIKDGTKSPSKQRLNADQVDWIERWRGGPVVVLRTAEAADRWARNVKGRRP